MRIVELSQGRRELFIGCTYVPQFIPKEVGREYLRSWLPKIKGNMIGK